MTGMGRGAVERMLRELDGTEMVCDPRFTRPDRTMFTRELKEGNSAAALGQVSPMMGNDLYEVGRALAHQNILQQHVNWVHIELIMRE